MEAFKDKCPEHAQSNIVMIGNKCDLPDREVSMEEAEFLARQIGAVAYFECSAKENINVIDAFDRIAINSYENDEKKR